jgi:opacity protein-like surface antigen
VLLVKYRALATAFIAFGATPAIADNESGLYLGAGAGQFNVEVDDIDDSDDIDDAFDADDTVYKVFGGWRLNPFIAIELNYIDLGSPDDDIGPINVTTEIDGFAPYLVGTLPVGPIEVFARVGYYFYDIEVNARDIRSFSDSDEDLAYGAGVGITLLEHLHARLEYEIIDISEVDDANAVWLSGAWRF